MGEKKYIDSSLAADPVILDAGLALALEWGEHWLAPIHDRLAALHPGLAPEDLNRYDTICRATMHFGFEEVARCRSAAEGDEKGAQDGWERVMLEKYPWISRENLSRVYSQGMYYLWKDGGL